MTEQRGQHSSELTQGSFSVGVISDTHGLLREEVKARLRGLDMILHAGDVCSQDILPELAKLAPVYAVCGNCDRGAGPDLPARQLIQIADQQLYMLHNLHHLEIEAQAAGIQVVIHGHTHVASQQIINQVLYVNPGSVGPRRFRLPITMGLLTLKSGKWTFEIITLE